jgi:hypothetical protein
VSGVARKILCSAIYQLELDLRQHLTGGRG